MDNAVAIPDRKPVATVTVGSVSLPIYAAPVTVKLKADDSGIAKEKLGFLAVLHFKFSMHKLMLEKLGLTESQSIYLNKYGHAGQIDQILSLHLALEQGKVKEGTIVSMIAAGIGYAWAANVIKWGNFYSIE